MPIEVFPLIPLFQPLPLLGLKKLLKGNMKRKPSGKEYPPTFIICWLGVMLDPDSNTLGALRSKFTNYILTYWAMFVVGKTTSAYSFLNSSHLSCLIIMV